MVSLVDFQLLQFLLYVLVPPTLCKIQQNIIYYKRLCFTYRHIQLGEDRERTRDCVQMGQFFAGSVQQSSS